MRLSLLLITIVAIIIVPYYFLQSSPQKNFSASVVSALSNSSDIEGLQRATEIREFLFPQDHGAHRDFQTEWWYYTGNLQHSSGRRFGFQLTIFRHVLQGKVPTRTSSWATRDMYFAHFAISDIAHQRFYHAEKYSREGLALAGAKADPMHVWIESWSMQQQGKQTLLIAQHDNFAIDLSLTAQKPIVLNGNQGLSQKSHGKGYASYYYSQTRLATSGKITIADETFEVRGFSWLDREWSTQSMHPEQIGWDWFALQLDNSQEIMLYQLKKRDGSIDAASSGTFTAADGKTHHLSQEDFSIEVLERWKSPQTGVVYPASWKVMLSKHNICLYITPHMANQEVNTSFIYWEGAVKIHGDVSGNGYVELTGYNEDINKTHFASRTK